MRRAWAAAVLAAGVAAFADDPVVVRGADMKLLNDVKELAARTAGLLGIRASSTPAAVRAASGTRREVLDASLRSSIPGDRLAARGTAWEDLGLGDSGLPERLRRALGDDLEGACLDADGRKLYVDPERLSDADFSPSTPGADAVSLLLVAGVRPDEPLLAHYVEHARTGWTPALFPETTDALLARAAWSEGRANLAALAVLFEGVGLAETVAEGRVVPSAVLGGRLVPEAFHSGSPVERSLLFFVYEEGFAQTAARFRAGGFGRVVSESSLRKTARDVLHPDRAPFGGELPEAPAPLEGFRVADRDVLGEQGVVTLVSTLTGKDNLGLLAGDGWAGDVLVRYASSERAGPGYTVWVVRSTDAARAGDLEYGLLRGFEERYAGFRWEGPSDQKTLRPGGRAVRFRRAGNVITLRIASSELDASLERSSLESPPRRAPTVSK